MIDLPTYAEVFCADGLAGRFTALVGDPGSHKLSHLVVQSPRPPFQAFLVPVDQVEATRPARITLKCTQEALHQMAPFEVEEYVPTELPVYLVQAGLWPTPTTAVYTTTTYVPVKRWNLPDGEIFLRRGARVEATDGYAGQLEEVLLEAGTGQVSDLVLLRAHQFDPREITIPAAQIAHVYEDTVYLKLDLNSLNQLPAPPPERWWQPAEAPVAGQDDGDPTG